MVRHICSATAVTCPLIISVVGRKTGNSCSTLYRQHATIEMCLVLSRLGQCFQNHSSSLAWYGSTVVLQLVFERGGEKVQEHPLLIKGSFVAETLLLKPTQPTIILRKPSTFEICKWWLQRCARARTQSKVPAATRADLALREPSDTQSHEDDMCPLDALSPTQLALLFLNNRTAISLRLTCQHRVWRT